MIKQIRLDRGMSIRELGDIINVPAGTVGYWERKSPKSSETVTHYIDMLDLSDEEDNELRLVRKRNWVYDDNASPITNELRRIRNGLGRGSRNLSLLMGRNHNYWSQLEHNSRSLSVEDLDRLSHHFNLSSTTVRRLNIINERNKGGKPIPESYMTENPEIQDPVDLYDQQTDRTSPAEYLDLLRMIEDENGGSIANASEDDPKLKRLRDIMGVEFHDEEEEHNRVSPTIGWVDLL